jgi:hypothetical protein
MPSVDGDIDAIRVADNIAPTENTVGDLTDKNDISDVHNFSALQRPYLDGNIVEYAECKIRRVATRSCRVNSAGMRRLIEKKP